MALTEITNSAHLAMVLQSAPPSEAIGAALSFLLDAADKSPGQLQVVLHTRVTRAIGKRVEERSIIEILASVARGF